MFILDEDAAEIATLYSLLRVREEIFLLGAALL
jgi:hypothetical protein